MPGLRLAPWRSPLQGTSDDVSKFDELASRANRFGLNPAHIEKVLRSAIANAEQKSDSVDVDRLVVSEAYVNEAPRMKRTRPAPMGRAYRYQRRLSHITVAVSEGGVKR